MNQSEINFILLDLEKRNQTLVEYTIELNDPGLLSILIWAKWDRIKGIFRVKVMGIVIKDFAPIIEDKLIIPIIGPRPI